MLDLSLYDTCTWFAISGVFICWIYKKATCNSNNSSVVGVRIVVTNFTNVVLQWFQLSVSRLPLGKLYFLLFLLFRTAGTVVCWLMCVLLWTIMQSRWFEKVYITWVLFQGLYFRSIVEVLDILTWTWNCIVPVVSIYSTQNDKWTHVLFLPLLLPDLEKRELFWGAQGFWISATFCVAWYNTVVVVITQFNNFVDTPLLHENQLWLMLLSL